MSVRECLLIAVEGTHASGKTTLVHALTAYYRARGILVDCTGEPARTSPFIEEIVIHGRGSFDLPTEIDLFGAQLTTTLRATRHQQLLICDKTIMNVLAYARLVLPATDRAPDAAVLDAMTAFCRAWAPTTYDAVFYLPDTYTEAADPMRAKVRDLQTQTATAVRAACIDTGIAVHDIPAGLDLNGRITHITRQVDRLLTDRSG